MNLTKSKVKELQDRGRSWLHYIGGLSNDTEDIIQNAMVYLIKDHTKRCAEVEPEHFADKNWKKMMHSAYVDWVRRTKSYAKLLERYADSINRFPDREVFILEARTILNRTFPKLTKGELSVILALMENGFKVSWAAIELNCYRQHVYQTMWRIRDRLAHEFDFSHNTSTEYNGPEVEYLNKRGIYFLEDTHWSMNHPTCTEVFDTEELTQNGFTDKEEAEKFWPVTIIKGEDYEA